MRVPKTGAVDQYAHACTHASVTTAHDGCRFATPLVPLAVGRLVKWIKLGRLPADEVITMRMLRQSRAIGKKVDHGVRLQGLGAESVDIPINIEVC